MKYQRVLRFFPRWDPIEASPSAQEYVPSIHLQRYSRARNLNAKDRVLITWLFEFITITTCSILYYSSDMLKGYVAVEGENISKAVSKLPHIKYWISIGNSMICSDIWHKYHEWYLGRTRIFALFHRQTYPEFSFICGTD